MILDIKTNPKIFPKNEVTIIYDDGCPVCSYYVSFSTIKEKFGKLNLLKARSNEEVLKYVKSLNLDINEGMIVYFEDKLYYGHDAINIISILGNKKTIKNKLAVSIFKHKLISKALYPILKIGRRILLIILGKKLIWFKKNDK